MKLIKILVGTLALISSTSASPTFYAKDRCGKYFGFASCDAGKCCSKYGWCGTSKCHCQMSRGCQSNFGECTRDDIKAIHSFGNVEWAGFCYSPYGVKESFNYMPSVSSWNNYINRMKSNFYDNTKGTVILIVGVISKDKYCSFGFPEPGYISSSLNVKFSDTDEYEDFLKKCDEKNYKVWLQVEAGDNDLAKLADIVLDRYGHHASVNLALIVNGGIEITIQKDMVNLFLMIKLKKWWIRFVREIQVTLFLPNIGKLLTCHQPIEMV